MPTISGMRRRGYSPQGLRNFARNLGVSKTNGLTEIEKFEHYIREDLNRTSPRVMTVLRPLKLVLTNYPEGQVEFVEAINNPENADAGTRSVPFGRELWIDREDFLEAPPKRYHRLYPGNEVRLLVWLHHQMSPCRERPRYGRDHGDSLHIRSTDAQRPANAESEVNHSLGFGSGGDPSRGSASMTSCSPSKIQMSRPKVKISRCT